jgi:hypothetical protein
LLDWHYERRETMAENENVKTPKLKGSDIDSETAASQDTRRLQPGAQGAGKEAKALDESGELNESKLRENQERLRQTPEHKTPEMDKKDRGTFP